ncbi:MAG: HAD-IIIA family hydrolase [Candidatus Aminicenantes bacterium]|nr:HAD-IIIA family hydrolase [Candidatus Aminicenantes bacterium]
MKNKAVLLDRDGNINEDIGYPDSYKRIKIYPYSYEAVRKINQSGFLALIVTNQSGVGRGLIPEKELQKIHKKMEKSFQKQGARIDRFYYCPHYVNSLNPKYKKDCQCRKPNPGMALKAARELDIDLSQSYMIGDKVEDILFGVNIKATPILVLTGFGKRAQDQLEKMKIHPAYVAKNLLDAVNWILKNEPD